jgi:hypothetical protein
MPNFSLISLFDFPPFMYIIPLGLILASILRSKKVEEFSSQKRYERINKFSVQFDDYLKFKNIHFEEINSTEFELRKMLYDSIGIAQYSRQREYAIELIMQDISLDQILKKLANTGLNENNSLSLLQTVILQFRK